jgi:YD repeat-containing protein
MPLSASTVGLTTTPFEHDVDARWIMAYAAALADLNPRMMDTTAATPVIAHPVFPVCLEWPVILASRALPGSEGVSREEAARSVHAAHDLHIFRPIRAGDHLTTVAEVVGMASIRPGTAHTTRLLTRDAAGKLVCITWQLGISRAVALEGEQRSTATAPPLPGDEGTEPCDIVVPLVVPAGMAHVYTECARIWNPIHSDRAVALAAGLPDIILHGTATLALAVSGIVNHVLEGDIARVCRLGGRFSAMVPVPDTLQLEILRRGPDGVRYQVRNGAGEVAISQGFLCWR